MNVFFLLLSMIYLFSYDEFVSMNHVGQVERKRVLCHPRSLISAFIVRSLDSIISLVSRSEISRF